MLEVSSREQEREQGGEDYPNVEAHREEPRRRVLGDSMRETQEIVGKETE